MSPDQFLDAVPTIDGIVKPTNGRRNPNVTFMQEFLTEDGRTLMVAVTDLTGVPGGE